MYAIGAGARIGLGEEDTEGTGVTPTAFVPLRATTLNRQVEQEVAEPLGYSTDAAPMARAMFVTADNAGGTITTSLYYDNVAVMLLFKHLFGTVTTGGSGPSSYTYTYDLTRAQPAKPSLTVEDVKGTAPHNNAEQFTGSRVAALTLDAQVGQVVTAQWTILSRTSGGKAAATSVTYSNDTLATHNHATEVAFNGSALTGVTGVTLTIDKMLERTPVLGSLTSGNMIQAGLVTGQLVVKQRWNSNAAYAAYLAGTEATGDTLTFTNGTRSLVFTFSKLRVRTCEHPVSAVGVIEQTTTFDILATTSFAGVRAVLTNNIAP